LFVDMPWSTSAVLPETVRRAETLGLRVAWLPAWFDVDTPEDLARLRATLSQTTSEEPRHTRQFFLERPGCAPPQPTACPLRAYCPLRHASINYMAALANIPILASRFATLVSIVRVRSTGPATAMQAWPASSPKGLARGALPPVSPRPQVAPT